MGDEAFVGLGKVMWTRFATGFMIDRRTTMRNDMHGQTELYSTCMGIRQSLRDQRKTFNSHDRPLAYQSPSAPMRASTLTRCSSQIRREKR